MLDFYQFRQQVSEGVVVLHRQLSVKLASLKKSTKGGNEKQIYRLQEILARLAEKIGHHKADVRLRGGVGPNANRDRDGIVRAAIRQLNNKETDNA